MGEQADAVLLLLAVSGMTGDTGFYRDGHGW
jgi:hypothetical protein